MHEVSIVRDIIQNLEEHYKDRFSEIATVKIEAGLLCNVQPFGAQCKLQPTSGGYLPCSYAPAGKWTSCYEKVKVLGKSCVTEASELQCAIGGKITVKSHGQQSEIGKSHIMNADSQEQRIYNPIVNLDELKKMLNEDFSDDYD